MRVESHQVIRKFSILTIPTHRVVWAWSLRAMQLCICLVLLVYGSLWLIATTHIPDLVLNAIALSFITRIDEIMYVTIPRELRTLVQHTEGLPLPSSGPRVVRPLVTLGALILCGLLVGLCLLPHAQSVRSAVDALCR